MKHMSVILLQWSWFVVFGVWGKSRIWCLEWIWECKLWSRWDRDKPQCFTPLSNTAWGEEDKRELTSWHDWAALDAFFSRFYNQIRVPFLIFLMHISSWVKKKEKKKLYWNLCGARIKEQLLCHRSSQLSVCMCVWLGRPHTAKF